jgi:hypothetical protein
MEEHKVLEYLFIHEEKCMKVLGIMIRPMASVHIFTLTELNTKENGIRIFNREKELKDGLMAQSSLEIMERARKMELANTSGLMGLSMKVNGKIMKLLAMDTINGQMEESI